jgi:hypothetical protein
MRIERHTRTEWTAKREEKATSVICNPRTQSFEFLAVSILIRTLMISERAFQKEHAQKVQSVMLEELVISETYMRKMH